MDVPPPPAPPPPVRQSSTSTTKPLKTKTTDQLKHVTTRDASVPILNAIEGYGEDAEAQFVEANIEHWYPLLQGHTPKTTFLPISKDAAELIIASYNTGLENTLSDADPRILDLDTPLEENEKLLRDLILAAVQSKIDEFGEGRGCFVKASSRSPKDTMVKTGRIQSEYYKILKERKDTELPSVNQRLGLFFTAGFYGMRQFDARQVIRSFCLSMRVVEDLKLAIRLDDLSHQAFIFREWTEGTIDGEYRMFIPPGGKLTAISQYIQVYYSTRIVEMKDRIRQFLIEYLRDTIHPLLSQHYAKGYVLDVSIQNIHADPDQWRGVIIEVNPYLDTAGRCLFEDIEGQKIVHGHLEGLDYPVMRVTERVEGVNALDKPWQRAMQEAERRAFG